MLPTVEEKPTFVRGLFNRIAGRYDLLNNVISFGMHWGWKRKAVDCLQLVPNSQVLDVCTGTGDLINCIGAHLAPAQGGQITGLDFSEEMLHIARKRYAKEAHIHLLQGDAMALPFEAEQFDALRGGSRPCDYNSSQA